MLVRSSTRHLILVFSAMIFLAGCQDEGGTSMNSNAVDVNEMGPNNQHMIFWRIEQDDFVAVQAFLDAGVDPDVRGFLGMTPAIWAAGANSWRMVELLAERGADLSIKARNGMSVPAIVRQSQDIGNVRLSSPDGQAFLRVQALLESRGLL